MHARKNLPGCLIKIHAFRYICHRESLKSSYQYGSLREISTDQLIQVSVDHIFSNIERFRIPNFPWIADRPTVQGLIITWGRKRLISFCRVIQTLFKPFKVQVFLVGQFTYHRTRLDNERVLDNGHEMQDYEKHPKKAPRRKPHKHDLRVKRSCHKDTYFLVPGSKFCSEWIQDIDYLTYLSFSVASPSV